MLVGLLSQFAVRAQSPQSLLDSALDYHLRNPDSCIFYSNKILNAQNEVNDSIVKKALFLKAWNLHLKSNYPEAIETFELYLHHPASRENEATFIRSVGKIGVGFREQAKFDSAMLYLLEYDRLVDAHMPPEAIEAKLELG